MRPVPLLALAFVLAACAPRSVTPPDPASVVPPRAEGVAALAAPFRDYRLGAQRSGALCTGTPARGALRYVESLEYVGAPAVAFGLDADGCIREIRTAAAVGAGRYEHAVALATQRLGAPDGEDRALCRAAGAEVQGTFWRRPEGRFEVVRMGLDGAPEFVLRTWEEQPGYAWLCEGGVTRE